MDQDRMPRFEIPADMRAMPEKNVEQARIAFNTFMTVAQEAITTFENQAEAAQAGAKDLSGKALGYAERNVTKTLEFADRLLQAKDAQEFIRLQTEFAQEQMRSWRPRQKSSANPQPRWR
jgi:hypothetical protein